MLSISTQWYTSQRDIRITIHNVSRNGYPWLHAALSWTSCFYFLFNLSYSRYSFFCRSFTFCSASLLVTTFLLSHQLHDVHTVATATESWDNWGTPTPANWAEMTLRMRDMPDLPNRLAKTPITSLPRYRDLYIYNMDK
jgi:hypothetical protein